ncbi:hypothetical protein NHQ30_004693 [Ciborinia camelliae]|nr:hypothetical protein NHQ30_004693 [Ciborinia camelliae]
MATISALFSPRDTITAAGIGEAASRSYFSAELFSLNLTNCDHGSYAYALRASVAYRCLTEEAIVVKFVCKGQPNYTVRVNFVPLALFVTMQGTNSAQLVERKGLILKQKQKQRSPADATLTNGRLSSGAGLDSHMAVALGIALVEMHHSNNGDEATNSVL